MAQTKPVRLYPETVEKADAVNLPGYLDTPASRIDFLVRVGITAFNAARLPGPADADRPMVVTISQE